MNALNFAVIGAGYFGKNYVRVLQKIPGLKLCAVTARKSESLAILRKFLPASVSVTGQFEHILDDDTIDCVVIATPAETHFQIAKKAIECRKHVLLEKPMVMNMREAHGLRAALRKNPVTFMVGHQYVYNDCINYLKGMIDCSEFGKMNSYFGEHLYQSPAPHRIGCLLDAGTHQLSIIQHLFSPAGLKRARAFSLGSRDSKGEDSMCAALSFWKGPDAIFVLSNKSPEKTRRFILAGSEKTAVFDDVAKSGRVKIFRSYSRKRMGQRSTARSVSLLAPSMPRIIEREPLLNEVNHFIGCIRTGMVPRTGMDSGIQLSEWLMRIGQTMKKSGF